MQTSDRSKQLGQCQRRRPACAVAVRTRGRGLSRTRRAITRHSDGGQLGDEQTKSIAGTLYAKPIDNAWVRTRVSYQLGRRRSWPGDQPDADRDRRYPFESRRINTGTNLNGTVSGFNVSLPCFCDRVPTISQLGESIVSTNTTLTSPLLASLNAPNGALPTRSSATPSASSCGTRCRSRTASACAATSPDGQPAGRLRVRERHLDRLERSVTTRNWARSRLRPQWLETSHQFILQDSDHAYLRAGAFRLGASPALAACATRYSGHFISNFGNGGLAAYEPAGRRPRRSALRCCCREQRPQTPTRPTIAIMRPSTARALTSTSPRQPDAHRRGALPEGLRPSRGASS